MRVRVVVTGEAVKTTWALPTWAGPHEFGSVRVTEVSGPDLIQAALLAKKELVVEEVSSPEMREAARLLAHRAFVEEGDVPLDDCPPEDWVDRFDEGSILLVARANDMVIGTLRFVPDGPKGLPHQGYTPPRLWRPVGPRRVEATRLAVSRVYRPDVNRRLGVAVL